jgi:hypothetical protein
MESSRPAWAVSQILSPNKIQTKGLGMVQAEEHLPKLFNLSTSAKNKQNCFKLTKFRWPSMEGSLKTNKNENYNLKNEAMIETN